MLGSKAQSFNGIELEKNQPQYAHQDIEMNQPVFPSSDGMPRKSLEVISQINKK